MNSAPTPTSVLPRGVLREPVEVGVLSASMPERLIITIDGPAGTGKSSVARSLAARLGVKFLDTGAMYRAVAAIIIDESIELADHSAVVTAVERHDLHFDFDADPPELLCSGRSVMDRIRDHDVTKIVSPVAGIRALRQDMVRKQRQIAIAQPRLVAEGRDQGSVVFPDADVKFYLDASPAVRAKRRADQLRAAGKPADEQQLEREIIERDRSDSTRSDGPLVCPADASRVDTSNMSFEEVVNTLEAFVRRHMLVRDALRASRGHVPSGAGGSGGVGGSGSGGPARPGKA
jgi:CMP/dCMP kinase